MRADLRWLSLGQESANNNKRGASQALTRTPTTEAGCCITCLTLHEVDIVRDFTAPPPPTEEGPLQARLPASGVRHPTAVQTPSTGAAAALSLHEVDFLRHSTEQRQRVLRGETSHSRWHPNHTNSPTIQPLLHCLQPLVTTH